MREVRSGVADTKKRITDLTAQIRQPYEYEERLTTLLHRQQEITDALDLTKNQASAKLEADAAKELPDADTDTEALRECYEGEWY